jgi:16S rRNA (cytosine967-C5)-methyltransferase
MKGARKPARLPVQAGEVPGLAVRRIAADIVDGVLRRRRAFDEFFDSTAELATLEDRDRALVRALVAVVLRRLGTLRHLLGRFLDSGAPPQAPRVESALLIGAAQILFLDVPDHAAVDLSVRLAQADRHAARFSGLVNAVLRRVTREGAERLAALDTPVLDTPAWLMARWTARYGAETAHAIATANGHEPALDLTVKSDPEYWAGKLEGRVLATRTVRAVVHGAVTALPGFSEGAWWVQDAAAALPARLFGFLDGQDVVDLCAAPGGKTAQLAAAGARVTAIDRSTRRLERLVANLQRLALPVDAVAADALTWRPPQPVDAVLLDAPCSTTGAIRRHPDVPHLKAPEDVARLAVVQDNLLRAAIDMLRPGGTLVYCTCSLEPEEGSERIAGLLRTGAPVARRAIDPDEIGARPEWITVEGDLRTLPCHFDEYDGIDGFFCARLVKEGAPAWHK